MTGKQLGAMHEKDKKSGPPSSGHFEGADNGGFMLTMHAPGAMESAKTVHPSKKHMLKHLDAALGMQQPAAPRKPSGNLIKGPAY